VKCYFRKCYYRKMYYVRCRWIKFTDGGGTNYIETPSLARAIRANKKLKRRVRQIDVREKGVRNPYVLHNSWL